MEQLGTLDASFLYMETAHSPMHVGGVYIFEPPKNTKINFFETFKAHLTNRLHLSKVFRQRLVEVPLEMSHPYWINDPDFDIEMHIDHIALPQPAGKKELMGLAARIFSRPLDRKHPLWKITLVEGLNNIKGVPKGSFAMIAKVHHAAIDGVSGAAMMGAILDTKPNAKPIALKDIPKWETETVPTGVELIARSYGKAMGAPFKIAKFLYDAVSETIDVAKDALANKLSPPAFPFTAPRTIFNAKVSSKRSFGGLEFTLDQIKAIKNQAKSLTVNDVVLGICSGALRRYLIEKEALPEKSLISMSPISVRSQAEKYQMGNKLSAMLVALETQESDPIERLKLIHKSAKTSKMYAKGTNATKLMEFIPSELAALAARLYTQIDLSDKINPAFNLVITNVPGPPVPLYMNGSKVIRHFGMAPVLDGLGLLIVVFSYAGNITFSVTACREIMPDVDKFIGYLQESMEELTPES